MQDARISRNIFFLIFSVILVQLVGRYYSSNFIYFESFQLVFFIGRLAIPLLLSLFVFHFTWRDLGLNRPKLSKAWIIFSISSLLLIPLIVSSILLDASYLKAYPYYTNAGIPPVDRLLNFGLFTLSTLVGWEFMHRSFLLFGLHRLLGRAGVSAMLATSLSISVTAVFEILFHFQKPDLEAWGLVLASPLFSWMALKTKSIYLPSLLHLYIEICFILTMILSHA